MGHRTRNDDGLLGGRFSHKSGVLRLLKKKEKEKREMWRVLPIRFIADSCTYSRIERKVIKILDAAFCDGIGPVPAVEILRITQAGSDANRFGHLLANSRRTDGLDRFVFRIKCKSQNFLKFVILQSILSRRKKLSQCRFLMARNVVKSTVTGLIERPAMYRV